MSEFEARLIGERIQQARNERGMRQEDLAAVGSFSKRSLQDYEAGVTIPYRHFTELARILGKPAEWFLHGEDEKPVAVDERELREHLDRRLDAIEDQLAALAEQQRELSRRARSAQ